MGAQSNTEQVLRSLHVLLSKSEPYAKEPTKVIVDKEQMLKLLSELNNCIYQIMEEYELTKRSRDKAEREFRKHGDQIIWDASRKAEDVYAASVLYMDDALNRMQEIVGSAREKVNGIYSEIDEKMKQEVQFIRSNQSELKSQMQDLVDTEKYLKIIEEQNRAREKAKNAGKPAPVKEASIYANRQTDIKINQEYLDKLGLSIVDEAEKETPKDNAKGSASGEMAAEEENEIRINLDADYFQWKEEQDQDKKKGKPKAARKRGRR